MPNQPGVLKLINVDSKVVGGKAEDGGISGGPISKAFRVARGSGRIT
jgi:hypothetical protein